MCWWIILALAACCGGNNNCERRRRNPCRRFDDPYATFPRTNVYPAAKPCRPRERD